MNSAVVIGGGLLGIEVAAAHRARGLRVHLVETRPGLMPAQLDQQVAPFLRTLLERHSIAVDVGVGIEAISASDQRGPDGVLLADGRRLPAGLVVFATGVRPRDELGVAAGLDRADQGGILTDAAGATSNAHVHAIGDCAALGGSASGLLAPGVPRPHCWRAGSVETRPQPGRHPPSSRMHD